MFFFICFIAIELSKNIDYAKSYSETKNESKKKKHNNLIVIGNNKHSHTKYNINDYKNLATGFVFKTKIATILIEDSNRMNRAIFTNNQFYFKLE